MCRLSSDESDARPTLLVIPGMGGLNRGLRALCADWGHRFNCVILDYPDWPRLADPRFGMADLEADFIGRIRAIQPAGPILLAGYSLGGFVAWAVAQRLTDSDHPVSRLLIFDSDISLPVPALQRASLAIGVGRFLGSIASAILAGKPSRLTAMLARSIAFLIMRHAAIRKWVIRHRHWKLPASLREALRFALSGLLQGRIVVEWQTRTDAAPSVLHGTPALVFVAEAEAAQGGAGDFGWTARCAALSIDRVTGAHRSLLSERGDGSLYQRMPLSLAASQGIDPEKCADTVEAPSHK